MLLLPGKNSPSHTLDRAHVQHPRLPHMRCMPNHNNKEYQCDGARWELIYQCGTSLLVQRSSVVHPLEAQASDELTEASRGLQASEAQAAEAAAAAQSQHAKLSGQAEKLQARLEAVAADNARLGGSVAQLSTEVEDKAGVVLQLSDSIEGLTQSLHKSEGLCTELAEQGEELRQELGSASEQVCALHSSERLDYIGELHAWSWAFLTP